MLKSYLTGTLLVTHTISIWSAVPVKITQGPKSTAIEEGSDLRLTCTATGQPKPGWERLGPTLDTKRLIVDGATFILKSLKVSDSGTYSCRTENLINFETASGSVVVVPKLHLTVPPPQNVTIFAGKSLILHCQADSGDFSVVVTWPRSNGPQLTARHRTLANGLLLIEKASLADQGTYICTARNFLASLDFRVGVNIHFPSSCSEIKRAGF